MVFSNYEDPACECPYDGREGGYQYIYGEPYDAEEILSDEFNGVFPEEIIKELSTKLFEQCWQWSAKPTQDWYEDYEFEIKDAYATFIEKLKQIDDLLTVEIKPVLENSYNKMLFVSIITALDTYLKDKFMFNLFKSNGSINCLLSKNQEIKKQSYNLLMIHNDPNFVNHKIKEFLYNKMWHILPKINGLYQQAFDIKLNLNKMLIEAVGKRHDIVHRNGRKCK